MNQKLEDTRAAKVAANARAEKMERDAAEDVAKLEEARKQRDDVIDRMSAGEEGIHRASYTQAAQTVRERELAVKLSSAMAQGARRRADEAERVFFIERAADFRIRHADAQERVLTAALQLDRSLARTNDCADDLRRAERDRVAIAAEEAAHNQEVAARADANAGQRANESLAALHPSERPLVRYSHNHPGRYQMPTLTAELVRHEGPFSGKQNTILTKTAEEFVAAHGITPPAPPPPPPPSLALEPEPAEAEPVPECLVAAE